MPQLFVKTLTGKTVTIEYDNDQTVLQLKEMIAQKEGIAIAEQRIIYCGKQLSDRTKLGGFDTQHEGMVHLVLRIANNDPRLVSSLDNEDQVKLLWTVNYLQETDSSFSTKRSLITTADDLATVGASFKKRYSQEAAGQATYISLTAVNQGAFTTGFTKLEADAKYQPAGGGMSTYVQNAGEEQIVLPLVIAIPKEDGGFTIVQNTDPVVRASARYQQQYRALLQQLYPVPVAPVAATTVATETAIDPSAFQAATDVINAELDFAIPEGDDAHERATFQQETERFLDALARITSLPVADLPAGATLDNILLAELNTCRTLVAATITDAQLISHVRELVTDCVAMHAAPAVETAHAGAGAAEAAAGAAMSPAEMAAAAYAGAMAARAEPAAPTDEELYLFFDHGGVLDGVMMASRDVGANDLVLQQFEGDMAGFSQVLPRGKEIVEMLNTLVERHGYKIGFHSANSRTDQLQLLGKLQAACAEKGIRFPEVHAMAVLDETNAAASTAPEEDELLSGIKVATWGADKLDGKTSVRQALSALLTISPAQYKNHVVFDDGPGVIDRARAEGYQAVCIAGDMTLLKAVQATYDAAQTKSVRSQEALPDDNNAVPALGGARAAFFAPAAPAPAPAPASPPTFAELTEAQKDALEKHTAAARAPFLASLEVFWDGQLDIRKLALLEATKAEASAPTHG